MLHNIWCYMVNWVVLPLSTQRRFLFSCFAISYGDREYLEALQQALKSAHLTAILKKKKKSTLLIRGQNSFMTRTAQLNGKFNLETVEKRRHQRKYDNIAYLPCVWLFNHGQLLDTDGLTAHVLGSQRDPPYNLRITVVFILPCLWWLCSINSIIFQGVKMS